MRSLEWLPETYPASGGLAAAGFYKLLGRPRLDPLTVLVRETAQNSWDARDATGRPVAFSIDGWSLNESERSALRDAVLPDATKIQGVDLRTCLRADELTGIYISDRNTRGLGGPLRADQADPDDVYDWVDFVLNVGKANTQGQTGGTYGFGKTICYVVSSVNAVVIHSRTTYRGRPQSRLIACAIGSEFKHQSKLCTGRHWWGRAEADGPSPVTGAAADQLAAEIGMPAFDGDEMGTNLLVIGPDLAGRTLRQAMNFIAESVTWHLWPKSMRLNGGRAMEISVTCEGEPVTIPDPEDRPPLQGFAQAFRVLHEELNDEELPPGVHQDEIRSGRPRAHIGTLVTVPIVQRPRAEVDDGHHPDDHETPAPAAIITGQSHHVALMRAPELVVEYMEGPAPSVGGVEWAGVFKCRDEHDHPFALAEPPTHDSWQPDLLPKGPDKTVVNVGLREIRRALDSRWAPHTPENQAAVTSTARVADNLAHLVRSTEGRGAGRRPSERDSTPSAGAKVRLEQARPIIHEGQTATLATVVVSPRAGSAGTRLDITVGAALDGTTRDATLDPDLRLVSATWNGQSAQLTGESASLNLGGRAETTVELLLYRGPRTSVLVDVSAEAIEQ